MLKHSLRSLRLLFACLALTGAAFLVNAPAIAQAEPTINQIYEAAQSGKLDLAQTMVQQVLIAHPNSAKAHFAEAELLAKQGRAANSQAELSTAERLAPGLPFAKPAAVQELKAQIATSQPSAASRR